MPVNRTGPRGYTRGLWRVHGHGVGHHTGGGLDPGVNSAMHPAMNMPVGTKKTNFPAPLLWRGWPYRVSAPMPAFI